MSPAVDLWLKSGSFALRSFCLIHIIHSQFYEFTETRGESMLPTLAADNDYVHALKTYRDGKGCQIGDCIVAVKPTDPYQRVCKRITGMPGDVILVDPSAKKGSSLDGSAFDSFIRVPPGHVWVTGDNLSHSLDSRTYNSLPMGLIKGKIVAANDFNKPIWRNGVLLGFRTIDNTYVDEG
ncbi:LANO_0G17964g1_1 [Lachancea nothofagi CBS 11611]|uniref:Mitochondrial inner membrane protease subunit n=1 Tax=Lachancea nothofagi CBS 11611 TaxID=1266666 RepID=A0A1G4KKS2_9SACH|nr:LANO_0G17964g1_1 [Lachancea nothofagi CBS 11611]